ncbi:MAG: AAA family ATPase [Nitrospiraceae bacterium]|nr:AAA family ATPase [Nitrospiraceae bacterium]
MNQKRYERKNGDSNKILDDSEIRGMIERGKIIYNNLSRVSNNKSSLVVSLNFFKNELYDYLREKGFPNCENIVSVIKFKSRNISYDDFFSKLYQTVEKSSTNRSKQLNFIYHFIDGYIRQNITNEERDIIKGLEKGNIPLRGAKGNSIENNINEFDFDDVIGQEKAVDIIKYLSNSLLFYMPEYRDNPAKPFSTKVLLYGLPGTGKTFSLRIAESYLKRMAQKRNLSFKSVEIEPADFGNYMWESERQLKEKFEEATNPNGIGMVIVDESDTLFSKRGFNEFSKSYDSMTGEILRLLDGFSTQNYYNYLVFFLSNNPKQGLDPALLSRIELKVSFNSIFSKKEYKELVEMYIDKYSIDKNKLDLDRDYFVEQCYNNKLSPRSIKNILFDIIQDSKTKGINSIFDKNNLESVIYEINQSNFEDVFNLIREHTRKIDNNYLNALIEDETFLTQNNKREY